MLRCRQVQDSSESGAALFFKSGMWTMNKELIAERKERYVWEFSFVVLMLFMNITNYGQESPLSLAFGMEATKIFGFVFMAALTYWAIYRGIGFIRLFHSSL